MAAEAGRGGDSSRTQLYEQMLVDACMAWPSYIEPLSQLRAAPPPRDSRLGRDAARAGGGELGSDVWEYVLGRASNACNLLDSLSHLVLGRVPGSAYLDASAMHPLLRAVLEDAATIVWLLEPEPRRVRMVRALRLLTRDLAHIDDADALMKRTLDSVPMLDRESREEAAEALAQTSPSVSARIAVAIRRFQIAEADLRRKPLQSEIIREAFGVESREFAAWKLLSNLSHYSYGVTRQLPWMPGDEGRGSIVLMVGLVADVNGAVIEAIMRLADAVRPSPADSESARA